MTLRPTVPFPMQAVLRNLTLLGSTMGSRAEFSELIAFVNDHADFKPVVSRVVQGLDDLKALDGLWDDMKEGKQFGKLVVEIWDGQGSGDESDTKGGKGSRL